MAIQLPENIDLNRSGQYILVLEVQTEAFSFFLYNPDHPTEHFFYRFPVDKRFDAFSQFQEAFFDQALFTHSFRKIFILNRTPQFTYIPNILFKEENKQAYMQFLFTSINGRILHQTLSKPEMTVLHTLPEDVYGFLRRSFPEAPIVHYTAAAIAWCQEKEQWTDGNRMVIYRQPDGVNILCFSRQQLLLCNHFPCQSPEDAVYYAIYTYKQLNFSQLTDFIYLVQAEGELQEKLSKYIQNVIPVQWEETEYYNQLLL